jgi:nitroimidazol reductase NimA-like FMN-containing flavoprotein (pyridoxamine 5'-phosphate oxidase superfamily)
MVSETAKSEAASECFAATPVNRVKRAPTRGRYDKKTIYDILDSAIICNIAYVVDGRPYCTPTGFWREGDHLYWHGSSASRMIRAQAQGIEVCLTVSHIDALVMARSGFHHSVNYRAVMAFGRAHLVEDTDEKRKLMDNYVDRIYPGRSKLIRQPTIQELKATAMMSMEIESASGKIRDTHVQDDEDDYEGVPAWSAVYPVRQVLGAASECARQISGLARPAAMDDFVEGSRFDELMAATYAATFD